MKRNLNILRFNEEERILEKLRDLDKFTKLVSTSVIVKSGFFHDFFTPFVTLPLWTMLTSETLFHSFLQSSATVKQLTGSSAFRILSIASYFTDKIKAVLSKLSVIQMEQHLEKHIFSQQENCPFHI